MKLTGMTLSTVLALTISGATLCHAGSITYGTSIDVSGDLKLTAPNTGFCFYDGTCMQSAINPNSVEWGDITGLIQNQTDLQLQMDTKQNVSQNSSSKTYVYNFLFSAANDLLLTNTDFQLLKYYHPAFPDSEIFYPAVNNPFVNGSMQVTYSDNIGIYADNINGTFCTVGLFLDNAATPICSQTYTGIYGYETYNQQIITCNVQSLSAGDHDLRVKHISDKCKYGHSPHGSVSTRQLTIHFTRND